MMIFCPLFACGVAYICFRGVSEVLNTAISVVQISALVVFSIIAVCYRLNHPQGSVGIKLDPNGAPISEVIATDEARMPVKDAQGNFVLAKTPDGKDQVFTVDYSRPIQKGPDARDPNVQVDKFQYHGSAASVMAPHNFSYVVVQACIAILILVGFESVTSMGEEAKNAQRDVPRAVILSLLIQGLICYLIEYFAANYFLHNGYQMSNAMGSGAPVGDMMIIAGTWLFGSAAAGKAFMLVQASTVFLALVGTTLACMSTGARVTYAMGRDEEVPEHFGLLHGEKLTPHRAIWTLAILSAVIGVLTILFNFAGPGAQADDTIKALPHNFWYSFGLWSHDLAAKVPQSSVVITLVSNFGTFLLYMMTCVVAIVAFREHHTFNGFKHMFIPIFGVAANLMCMLFYLIGPFAVTGMSWREPYVALAICAVWAIYGLVYFKSSSTRKGREIYVTAAPKVKA